MASEKAIVSKQSRMFLYSRYAEARKSAALAVKKSKIFDKIQKNCGTEVSACFNNNSEIIHFLIECINELSNEELQKICRGKICRIRFLGQIWGSSGKIGLVLRTPQNCQLLHVCSKSQSCQFSNRSLFRSTPTVMNLGWWLKQCYFKYKWQRWNFCEEFTTWDFTTKCAAAKFANPEYRATSQNREIPATWFGLVSRRSQETQARQTLLVTSTGKRPRSRPRTR